MQLTPRLETIAREIASGETAADIGTDHGYIPIFLRQKEISEKVILTDISNASLDKAVKNAERAGISEGLDFRTGDGLGPLRPSEVDDVIIAGVGGELITSMLSDDIRKSMTFKKFVFQPRSKAGTLRRFLAENGFDIVRERLAEERGRICQVITALPSKYDGEDPEKAEQIRKEYAADSEIFGRYPEAGAGDIEWEAPVTLLSTREGLAEKFFLARLEKEKTRLAGIAVKKEYDGEIMSEAAGNTAYLRELLAEAGADGE